MTLLSAGKMRNESGAEGGDEQMPDVAAARVAQHLHGVSIAERSGGAASQGK